MKEDTESTQKHCLRGCSVHHTSSAPKAELIQPNEATFAECCLWQCENKPEAQSKSPM